MASSGLTIVFPVQSIYDIESGNKAMTDMQNALSKAKPLQVKWDIGAERGQSMVDKLGGGGAFQKMIDDAATGAGKLSVSFTNLRNTQTNLIESIPTEEFQTFKGVMGEVAEENVKYNARVQELNQKLASGKYELVGYSKTTKDFEKSQKLVNDVLTKAQSEVDRYGQAASKTEAKLKNMGGSQAKSAKEATAALQAEIKEFNRLTTSGQVTAGQLEKVRQAAQNMNVAFEGTKTGANVFQNFANRIGNAVQQTIAYSFSIGLVYKAQQLLNDSIRYAIDLNTEMTKIQVLQAEGAKTPEEINALAQSFNDLGQEMGASTLEIAKGSVEWFRQGRTVEETQKLMKASMMLSKLGAMESADATNYLTSITNAFKIEVGDTAEVVDKLIAVDNIAATSAGELATALRYTSETAALAGVSLEQLVSYIGTVSTVTRQNAEMIGQAFKTMFSRMTLIQGGGTDEEGWTISKVEKALSAVNIEMKEADGTFRNMGDVLEDTAEKWDTLGEREQIEIAVAIGGVRQKEAFLVLMDNMDKALTYQAAQYDANGLAMDRYGIYLESIQAKQGKLTASMQEFYASVVNSEIIGSFYDIAIGMVQTITKGHLLVPILITILTLLIAIKKVEIGNKFSNIFDTIIKDGRKLIVFLGNLKAGIQMLGMAFSEAGGGISGLGAAIGLIPTLINPATLAIVAIIAVISGGILIWQKHKKAIEDGRKAIEDYVKAVNSIPQKTKDASDVITQISDIIAKQGDNKRVTEELFLLYSQLKELLPDLNWKYADGRPYLDPTYLSTLNVNEELRKQILLTEEQRINIEKAVSSDSARYEILKNQADVYTERLKVLTDIQTAFQEGKFTNKSGFQIWFDNYKKNLGEITPSMAATLQDMQVIMGNTEYWNGEELAKNFGNAFQDTITIQKDNLKLTTDEMDKITGPWMQGVSAALGSTDSEIQDWLDSMENKYGDNKLWQFLFGEGKVQAAAINIEKGERDYIEKPKTPEPYSKGNEESIKAANEAYEKQLELIDAVVTGIEAIREADTSTLEGKAELTNSMFDFKDALAQIGPEFQGLSDSVMSFYDIETKTWDTKGLENWAKSIALNKVLMSQIRAESDETADSIEQLANDSIGAIKGMGNELTTLSVTGIGSVQVTADQLQLYYDQASQALWNAVGDADIGLTVTTTKGTQLTLWSAQQIAKAMADGLVKYESFAVALTQLSATEAAKLVSYMGQLLKTLGSGFVPKVPTFTAGGGGGGGGTKKEDPRIKELDRLIELEEDEIEKLEDDIELYNRQKEAIDRIIEAEEWKKELIDRQIAIYEEQIEDIDRQIELYERVKDSIDEVIDNYEKQKDAIDDLIDLQEKLKEPLEAQKDALDERLDSFSEYIDLQKESLERMKDEEDFVEELEKKHKKLSATKAELALATLDDSEEGIKRRLELEQQLSEDEEDLTEFTEERKYELQIRALDDAQKAFEKNIEEQIKLIDDQIKLIDDQIKKYEEEKGAIDNLIAPLEKQKEAIDNIIKPLEDQKIALEDLIYPLEEQKEAIDLVIQGYDDEKRAIDALIQPIQDTIQAMRDRIEVWQEEKEAIQEVIDAIGGGGGGGGPSLGQAYDDMAVKAEEALNIIIGRSQSLIEKTGLVTESVKGLINKYNEAGISAETLASRVEAAMRRIAAAMQTGGSIYGPGGAGEGTVPTPYVPPGPGSTIAPAPPQPGSPPQGIHEGGFASEHGPDIFEGTLKDSEVFAKLLKGEYVATEDQMRSFLRKTLPAIATEAAKMLSDERDALKDRARVNAGGEQKTNRYDQRPPSMNIQPIVINGPPTRPSSDLVKPINVGGKAYENAYRDIKIDMPIHVEGSLDEKVLPKLEKSVMKAINKSLEKRGIRRTADNFAI